jgi:hypothetical protein
MDEDIQYIINSPYTSRWLRNAIHELLERDPLDAHSDAKLLYELLHQRLNNLLEQKKSV